LQEQASNHLKLLWLRATVVSVGEKGSTRWDQVGIKEMNASKPLKKCRKRRDDVKTRGESLTWEESGGHLSTVQAASGMKAGMTLIQAYVWNVGTCCSDEKGEIQVEAPQE